VLKGALESLVLPPISLLYLAIIGLLIWRRHRRTGNVLVCLGLAGLLVLSLPVVSGALIVALEQGLPVTPPPEAMPQAIVILGGDEARIATAPFALPGPLSLDRNRAGAELRRKTGLPILVTGGTVQPDRPPVATIMAASLREDFQVPVAWIEDVSPDTWANATMSAAILRKNGINSVYLVTQAWHMRRAVVAFRKAGLIVTAAPTSFDAPAEPTVSDFVPRTSAWEWSFFAIHEWVGSVWYALR
jgi:uncharacterized SAM-binding protein YcdF (DUF218 family)